VGGAPAFIAMQFSDLAVDFPGSTNRLYQRVHELRAGGADLIDLVRGSVEEAGIVFPQDRLRDILAEVSRNARSYQPDPLGQLVAREAIATYANNVPERILLTPGTSVSYWYAFVLLANAGDEVLCPRPSYPLFDYIARLAGTRLTAYRLDPDRGWRIDFDDLEASISDRTRAVVLISPHNPTGMVATAEETERLGRLARRYDLAIISDEVFREFTFGDEGVARPCNSDAPLVFTLNGFSKMFALPGMKIGWMSLTGDTGLVERSLETLELISDTFLPVNEVAQFAVPGIFEHGGVFLGEYRKRIEDLVNMASETLETALHPCPRGGFYGVIRFGEPGEDEDLAIELLEKEHVLVHPGYLYDIHDSDGPCLVFSFVGDPERVRSGLARVKARLGQV